MEEVKHRNDVEALDHFREALNGAALTGAWMAAVWNVEDGKIRLVRRTSFGFPKPDFLAAIGHLAMSMSQEVLGVLPDEPLPRFPGVFKHPLSEEREDFDDDPKAD